MSYRAVNFANTIEMLANGSLDRFNTIQERLSHAVYANLMTLTDSDFPENDLRKEYLKLKNEFHIIKKMSLEGASELISKIVCLYLWRHFGVEFSEFKSVHMNDYITK